MVSLEKVKRFVEISGIKKDLAVLNNQMLGQLITGIKRTEERDKHLKNKFPEFYSEMVAKREKMIKRINKKSLKLNMNIIYEMVAKNFSDKELDELIAFYSSPVVVRLIELTSEVFEKAATIIESIAQEETETFTNKFRNKLLEISKIGQLPDKMIKSPLPAS